MDRAVLWVVRLSSYNNSHQQNIILIKYLCRFHVVINPNKYHQLSNNEIMNYDNENIGQ